MISEIFIISAESEELLHKTYRIDVGGSSRSIFRKKIKDVKSHSIPPHFCTSGVYFFNIRRNGLYIVATSTTEVSPVFVVELLSRFYHICKDFCGVVNEQAVKANLLLILEILDEFICNGYVQLATTDKLRPFIQSESVVIQAERSPAEDISSRVFGIETRLAPGSAANKPLVQSFTDGESRSRELFVDVVERLVATINTDGTTSRMEVNGMIILKNFLSDCPQIKLALNEDLVVSASDEKGYGNQVQLDRCTFHECVRQDDFRTSRVLVLNPPVGEFSAMTYSVSGDMSLNQPFRLLTFIGDAEGSKDLSATFRLRCDIPSNTDAVKVKVKIPVPHNVSSVSQKLSGDKQSADLDVTEKQIVWRIDTLPGKAEVIAQFRLINQGSGPLNRHEVGPVSLEFEISGYTSSGLKIRYLKIQTGDKGDQPHRWVRLITVSDSYVVKV